MDFPWILPISLQQTKNSSYRRSPFPHHSTNVEQNICINGRFYYQPKQRPIWTFIVCPLLCCIIAELFSEEMGTWEERDRKWFWQIRHKALRHKGSRECVEEDIGITKSVRFDWNASNGANVRLWGGQYQTMLHTCTYQKGLWLGIFMPFLWCQHVMCLPCLHITKRVLLIGGMCDGSS